MVNTKKVLGEISDFSDVKRKKFEQMCREDYGIELGEEYVLEVLQDIKYEHISSGKEYPIGAKFQILFKKGTKIRWLEDSNRRIVKLKFEGVISQPQDVTLNEGEFNYQRLVEDENGSSYRVRTNKEKFGKSTLKKGGTICIPASFFWTNFHLENGNKNVRILDKKGNVLTHTKDVVEKIVLDTRET